MKILKKLSALIAAVAIFGTSAMAADFKFDDKIEYTTGDSSVTVSFYAGENVNSIGQDASVIITYDTSVYTLDKSTALTSTVDGGWLSANANQAIWGMNGTYEITDKSAPLFTLRFDVKSGANPVGTKFATHADSWMYSIEEDDFDTNGMEITVTAAGPQITVTENTDGTYSVTGSQELTGKKVLFKDATVDDAATLTNTSRFVVSYNGGTPREFNIFDAVNAEGDGALDGKSVAFGIVYSDDLDASLFEFSIEE